MKIRVLPPPGAGIRAVNATVSSRDGKRRHLIVVFSDHDDTREVFAYTNECRHIPIPLDALDGQLLDGSRRYLMCHTHGALYEPRTGLCISGPCVGRRLEPVAIELDTDGAAVLSP